MKKEFDEILEKLANCKLPVLSDDQLSFIQNFINGYTDKFNITMPLSINSDVNALYFSKDAREMLIKFLDLLYKPLTN